MILLIQPPAMVKGREIAPPLGLMKIAAIPLIKGLQIKILDGNLLGMYELKKEIRDLNPDYVGFSTMTGPMLLNVLELSKFTKENTMAKVIWGGIHASLLPYQVMKENCVDIVVKGHGYYTLYNLHKNKKHLERVKGIIFKKGRRVVTTPPEEDVDYDSLPMTPWHMVNGNAYVSEWADAKRTLPIMTSLGCPYRCTFCYVHKFFNRKWYPFNFNTLKKEIDYVKKHYNLEGIRINSDNFIGTDVNRAIKITEYLKKRKLRWSCLLRMNQVNERILKTFKENGCNYIFYGIESGSERILKLINKDVSIAQAKNVIKITKKLRIRHAVGFMYDFPTETMEDVKQTMKLVNELNTYSMLSAFQPFPDSPLYDYCVKHGLFKPPKTTIGWANFKYVNVHNISQIPPKELETLNKKFNSTYNIFFNVKVALTNLDFQMLWSMGMHFFRSLKKGEEYF